MATIGLCILEDGTPLEFEHQADERIIVYSKLTRQKNPLTHF